MPEPQIYRIEDLRRRSQLYSKPYEHVVLTPAKTTEDFKHISYLGFGVYDIIWEEGYGKTQKPRLVINHQQQNLKDGDIEGLLETIRANNQIFLGNENTDPKSNLIDLIQISSIENIEQVIRQLNIGRGLFVTSSWKNSLALGDILDTIPNDQGFFDIVY